MFDEAGIAGLPRTFIDCIEPAFPNIAAMRRRVRSEPGWRVVELATGHDAMVSAADALAGELLACADLADAARDAPEAPKASRK